MWVDNSDSGVDESGSYEDGVTQNDAPMVLGADPEGTSSTRYPFTGRIQMAMVQKWRDH